MSTVTDLAAFLRARLDEDEAAARAVPGRAWYEPDDDRFSHYKDAAHIARHDPARTLREVEAGRARVALMTEATAEMDRLLADETALVADQAMAVGRARAATVVVKWDAMVHIAHPDYMPEWKPPVPATA